MAKLIYSAITSLDGYLADADGNFDWAEPDEEVHAFVNDLERPVGTQDAGNGVKPRGLRQRPKSRTLMLGTRNYAAKVRRGNGRRAEPEASL